MCVSFCILYLYDNVAKPKSHRTWDLVSNRGRLVIIVSCFWWLFHRDSKRPIILRYKFWWKTSALMIFLKIQHLYFLYRSQSCGGGCIVAKKQPAIGKVTAILGEGKVHMWTIWRTAWRPWKWHGGEIWSDKIPKSSLILVNFSLNDQDKLRPKTVAFSKRKYSELWS